MLHFRTGILAILNLKKPNNPTFIEVYNMQKVKVQGLVLANTVALHQKEATAMLIWMVHLTGKCSATCLIDVAFCICLT